MSDNNPQRRTGRAVTNPWPAPLTLALLSLAGLVAALLDDGFGDIIAWFALGAPVAVTLWHLARSGHRP